MKYLIPAQNRGIISINHILPIENKSNIKTLGVMREFFLHDALLQQNAFAKAGRTVSLNLLLQASPVQRVILFFFQTINILEDSWVKTKG